MDSLFCIKCSVENNAVSALHYVIKELPYNAFEIHSALELSSTALFRCRLAASRLREAAHLK